MALENAQQRIDDQLEKHIAQLKDFVRIPSISVGTDEDADAADEGDDEADGDDDGEAALSDEQKKEAEDLIAAISGQNISAATKEDMKEYKQDLADCEFDVMDLNYLRALRGRLS